MFKNSLVALQMRKVSLFVFLFLFFSLFLFFPASASHSYSQSITIDHTKVGSSNSIISRCSSVALLAVLCA